MDQQWAAYSTQEAPQAARQRYAPQHTMASPQQPQRDASVPTQPKHEYASPSRQNTISAQSPAQLKQEFNDGDGDVPMEDADPYKPKYGMGRPNHQHRHSQQFLQQEESAAARRYSPMNLSPTSPYAGNPQQAGQSYTSFSPQSQQQTHSNRQSPTRNNPYISPPNSYYSPPCTYFIRHKNNTLALFTNQYLCSLTTTCSSAPSHPVEHEP